MNEINQWLIGGLLMIGALLSFLSSIGFIRFPDIYTRSHAGTKSTTLGVICILMATFLFFWIFEGYISIRILLGILFVFLTAPVAGHLICRAAYRTKVPLWQNSVQDDLKLALKEEDYRHSSES